MNRQTPEPQDWHDVAEMLGQEPIQLPRPITTVVRRMTICPCCGWPHPPKDGCKAVERRDYSGR